MRLFEEFVEMLRSFHHLKVAKKKPLWDDADELQCEAWLWCRYCGKDISNKKKTFNKDSEL